MSPATDHMATSKHTHRADFAFGRCFRRGVKSFGSQVKWPDYDTMHQVVQYSDGQERRYKLERRIVDKSGDVAPFAVYYDEIVQEWVDSEVATATLLANDEPAISKKPAAQGVAKKPAGSGMDKKPAGAAAAAEEFAEEPEEENGEETEEEQGEDSEKDDSVACAAALWSKAAKAFSAEPYVVLYYKKSHQASIRQRTALGGKQIGSVGGKGSIATEAQLRSAASRTMKRIVAKTITECQCKVDMAEQLRDILAPHLD